MGDVDEMLVGPGDEGGEDRGETAAEVGDLVFDARWYFGVHRPCDESVAFELPESLCQDLRGDPVDECPQVVEALSAVRVELPEDRRGPPAEHEVDHGGDGAAARGQRR